MYDFITMNVFNLEQAHAGATLVFCCKHVFAAIHAHTLCCNAASGLIDLPSSVTVSVHNCNRPPCATIVERPAITIIYINVHWYFATCTVFISYHGIICNF